MSVLIKATAAHADVQQFTPRMPAPKDSAPPVTPLAAELEQARAENTVLRDALKAAHSESLEAETAAHESGRSEGYAAAEREDLAREKEVHNTLVAARGAWDERLSELDTLAAMLTRAALAKMFAEHEDLASLVDRAVSHRVDTLRRESVVAARVNGVDFPDQSALASLADHAGMPAAAFVVDPGLRRGECRFDLRLGHVDVGVADQARVLDSLLAELSDAVA